MTGTGPGRIGIEPVKREWADALAHGKAEFTSSSPLRMKADPVNGGRTCSSARTEH